MADETQHMEEEGRAFDGADSYSDFAIIIIDADPLASFSPGTSTRSLTPLLVLYALSRGPFPATTIIPIIGLHLTPFHHPQR